MQYILTEKEYKDLYTSIHKAEIGNKELILQLCIEVCDLKPVLFWGNKEAMPWGCIHSNDDWYCDECPVKEVCPETRKRASK